MVKITLNDFPAGNIYIKLKKDAILTIISLIKKSNLQLSKKNLDQIYRMKLNQKVPLHFVKNLAKTFNFPTSYIQENIILITSSKNTNVGIKNPKLSFNFNTNDGMIFIASLMAKGSINRHMQIRFSYSNKNIITAIRKNVQNIFGKVNYKIYRRQNDSYQLNLPRIVGLMIIKLKLLPLSKSISNNQIPGFIFKTNKLKKKLFLEQYIKLKGIVKKKTEINITINSTTNKKLIIKNLQQFSPKLLIGLKKLLKEINIKSTITLNSKILNKSNWKFVIKNT
jgi:hypothetical protein